MQSHTSTSNVYVHVPCMQWQHTTHMQLMASTSHGMIYAYDAMRVKKFVKMYMGSAGYPAKTCAHPLCAELMASGYLIWDQPQCKACPPMHDVAPTCHSCQT